MVARLGKLPSFFLNSPKATKITVLAIPSTPMTIDPSLNQPVLPLSNPKHLAFVGGAVGAVINRQLLEDVGLTARHAYRRRFLRHAALHRLLTGSRAAGD